ncbi:hypothetical protein FIBSPDRAFT_884281 [Athelia psychrophila]|uniref:CxC2-like cysteine cluster KDZ transposase-associated domain-containing protein n=1 Tax=Athelia psychrophila TaxID=1759441 RepID=A0A166T9M2_9AGAM|nr:hypothetical protein FIBSPDRAFT_884281 [Fibularhizoctonia sp. CBS 109695]
METVYGTLIVTNKRQLVTISMVVSMDPILISLLTHSGKHVGLERSMREHSFTLTSAAKPITKQGKKGVKVESGRNASPEYQQQQEPSDLDDNFANWDPGNGEDEGENFDEGDVDGQDRPSNVVSNLDLLATCQRYISSLQLRDLQKGVVAIAEMLSINCTRTTEAQVRLKLCQEEKVGVHEGRAALHETSTTGFLEWVYTSRNHICRIQIGVDTANSAQLTANQASLLEERCLQVWRKLCVFHDMQHVYIPHATAFILAKDEQCRCEDLPQPLAENNVTGQKKLTCSCTIIGLVGDHIVIQFKKYTQARKVLFKLGGVEEFSVRFKVLLQEHLMLDSDKQQDRVTFLHASVRREYLKARARKHCWVEEVSLLTEMCHILCFLTWHADWWMDRDTDWDGVHPDIADGLRAYTLRQAASCCSITEHFSRKWGQRHSGTGCCRYNEHIIRA